MKLLPAAKHGFMTFWYFHARVLNSLLPSVTLQGKRLVIFPGVYKPLENEQACSEYCREGDRVLDLGCGSGVGSVFCAPKAREVIDWLNKVINESILGAAMIRVAPISSAAQIGSFSNNPPSR